MALKPMAESLGKVCRRHTLDSPLPLLPELILGEGEAGQLPLHFGEQEEVSLSEVR